MQIISCGVPEKTGYRKLKCPECWATMMITKTDVKMLIKAFGAKTIEDTYGYYVACPKCGHNIKVKNEMENL